MKKSFYIIVFLAVLLSACGGSAPAATEPPVVVTEPPVVTEPGVTEVPIAATEPPATLVAINLAGPVMEVGSRYKYVDGTTIIAVPGGPFTMGDYFENNPERIVTVSDFWAYSTEVTNQQYALCVSLGECTDPDLDNSPKYGDYKYSQHPVTGVTYAQAVDYCTFVHGRLPTESEWEKLARGPDGNRYPWGNDNPVCSLLNFKFCVGSETTKVNEYKDGVSYYGAWDMAGNVKEWVADWFDPKYHLDAPTENPLGPENGDERLIKSSSYQDRFDDSLAGHRFHLDPLENLTDLGFRCVVEDPTYFAPWCELVPYLGEDVFGDEPSCAPTVNCNQVSINQAPNCSGAPAYQPYTIVTFKLSNDPPSFWSHDVSGCALNSEDAHNAKYECKPGASGPAKGFGQCEITSPPGCVAKCPDHYDMVGDKCIWDGSGTEGTACLPGSTYDPLSQCCTSLPGIGDDEVNLCPAGTYLVNGICVLDKKVVAFPMVSQPIIWDDACKPPQTGDDDNSGDDDDDGGQDPCPPPQVLVCITNQNGGQDCVCRNPGTAP